MEAYFISLADNPISGQAGRRVTFCGPISSLLSMRWRKTVTEPQDPWDFHNTVISEVRSWGSHLQKRKPELRVGNNVNMAHRYQGMSYLWQLSSHIGRALFQREHSHHVRETTSDHEEEINSSKMISFLTGKNKTCHKSSMTTHLQSWIPVEMIKETCVSLPPSQPLSSSDSFLWWQCLHRSYQPVMTYKARSLGTTRPVSEEISLAQCRCSCYCLSLLSLILTNQST